MLDTSRCTLSCGSLHSSVRYQLRPWRVSPGRVRSFTVFRSWSHWNLTHLRVQLLVPYGLGWGIARCCAPSNTDNSGETRTCLMGLIVPEDGVRMPLHARMAQHLVGERNWCTIPHSSLFSTGVVKSVDDLTLGDLWHFQPVCNVRLYELDTAVVVDTWYSSATVFTDLPDSRFPIKLNQAVSTTSVSHSKIKPLCKFDLLCPLCGKAFTHQWQIEHFCNFYFCTLEEKNYCVHLCIKCIFSFF